MKIKIDRMVYSSKKKALDEMSIAMRCCDGSEKERMTFAYFAVLDGFTDINTYREKRSYL